MSQTNIYDYLMKTFSRVPDKTAFADESISYSFRDVYERSASVAGGLADYQKEPVAVFMKRSPDAIVAYFGVMASGNFYVPLDMEMPQTRIELILQNIKTKAIICDNETIALAREWNFDGSFFLYEDLIQLPKNELFLNKIQREYVDTDPAYIVFTSGSTGVPKGVTASHRNVIDYIDQLSEELGFSEDTIFANQAPLSFDAPWKDIGSTVKLGATTYIVPKELFLFPVKLMEFLDSHKINTLCWVVSALTIVSSLNTFQTIIPKYLQKVVFVGEVFPMKQFHTWKKALPDVEYTNLYGPTEGTGVCCYYHVEREFEENEVFPIGQPFKNTQILLLNEKNERAGVGEEGEICIRGGSLTLGYYNDIERMKECFVQNPLNRAYPEMIYRTGDIGRYNEQGELMFVSRKDFQVKHMGHRIELGEIEVQLQSLTGIQSACCVYDHTKGKILLFFTGEVEKREAACYLKERLPVYMMPNRVRKLSVMPHTPNGKIDRKKLLQETVSAHGTNKTE